MAVSKKSGTPGRLDFSTALNEAVGEGVIKTPAPVKNPEQIKPSTITIEERTTQSADDTLAMKVAERAKKIKPKKHKVGGYISEDLYHKVRVAYKEQGITFSDLLEVVLTEYVNSVDTH